MRFVRPLLLDTTRALGRRPQRPSRVVHRAFVSSANLLADLPKSSRTFVLQNPPLDAINVSSTKDGTFSLANEDIGELKEGEALLETIYLSNDPAQRRWIQANTNSDNHYAAAVQQGEVMRSSAVARVLKVKGSAAVKEGDLVVALPGWREYAILPVKGLRPVSLVHGLQKGQSLIVSGAAGSVGNVVVQYAKNIVGAARVIAIGGSQAECDWLRKIGADIALNYKDSSFKTGLIDATEEHVDAYFDNVGGEILDAILPRMKPHGRIAACGAVSIYNDPDSTKLTNWFDVIGSRITIQGFLFRDHVSKGRAATAALVKAVGEGSLTIEGSEEICQVPFEEIPQVWGQLFGRQKTGKLVTQVKPL